MVGAVGSVVRAVRGGTVPGEIRVVMAGEPNLFLAFSADPMEIGARVRVVSSRGSRQVDVEPWP